MSETARAKWRDLDQSRSPTAVVGGSPGFCGGVRLVHQVYLGVALCGTRRIVWVKTLGVSNSSMPSTPT